MLSGIEVMEAVARITDPEAIVWRGDTALPSEDQGVRILGTPLGHPDYVRAQLQSLSATHDQLIAKVPTLPDLQCVWMVLLYCCAARANYTLRVVHPELTAGFAAHHDANVSVNFWGLTPALCIGTWPVCRCPWVAWDSEAPH